MGSRRQSRECAIQILYLTDVCKMNKEDAEKALLSNNDYDKEVVPFVSELIDGTISNLKEIDEYLVKIAENWELDRMASIDKAILRLASYELLLLPLHRRTWL